MKSILLVFFALSAITTFTHAQEFQNPHQLWADFDPDKGDFKEEIILEEVRDGIYFKEAYISAYVLGEEVRIYCKYAVKNGAKQAPALMDVHGWMGRPNISMSYVNDGWAVLAHDYCGKSGNRPHYTKYPEKLRYGNIDAKVGYRIKSKLPDGSYITDPKQTDDYLWYALQRRALSYLLAQKEVDKSRVGAKGYSYGGTIMWNLGMDERVKAIVAYFGIGYLEYFRTKSVWLYNNPYKEPKKTLGEELYLQTIAPQAHAPYINAAVLWLNGTNDHHGGHERSEHIFKDLPATTPWDFALQARGHHNTEKLGDDAKVWLEKHVLGKDHFWPSRPQSTLSLDKQGIPHYTITPSSTEEIESVKIYYSLKNPISYTRAWRDATASRQGDTWSASLPVMNIDDYVFAFANIHYKNNIVVSGDFEAAIPAKLGNAIATDEPSNDLSAQVWSDTAPVEGVGGIMGFRPFNKHRGTTNEQFSDPKWRAPKGAHLKFKFYCTQPQSLILKVNRDHLFNLEITASDEWQEMIISPDQVISTSLKSPLKAWSETTKIQIAPKPGADITKVIFANFEWIETTPKPAKAPIMNQDKVYLSPEMAIESDSFWRVMKDKSVSGAAISMLGKKYQRGLGLHADSKLTFLIPKNCRYFNVTPGADDAQRGELRMRILVDDKEFFNSGNISSTKQEVKNLQIKVSGHQKLSLIVEQANANKGGDHANWADAHFSK